MIEKLFILLSLPLLGLALGWTLRGHAIRARQLRQLSAHWLPIIRSARSAPPAAASLEAMLERDFSAQVPIDTRSLFEPPAARRR